MILIALTGLALSSAPVDPVTWSALQLQQRVHEELLRDGVSLGEQQLIFELSGDAQAGWIVALLAADDSSRARWLRSLPSELDAAAAELRLVVQGLLEGDADARVAPQLDSEARRLVQKIEIARESLDDAPLVQPSQHDTQVFFGLFGLGLIGVGLAGNPDELDTTWPLVAGGGIMALSSAAGALLPDDSPWSGSVTGSGVVAGMGTAMLLAATRLDSTALPRGDTDLWLLSGPGIFGTSMIASGLVGLALTPEGPACDPSDVSYRFASALAAADEDRSVRVSELERCLLQQQRRLDRGWILLAPMMIGAAANIGLGFAADHRDARFAHLAAGFGVATMAGLVPLLTKVLKTPMTRYLEGVAAQGLRLEVGAPGASAGLTLRGEL